METSITRSMRTPSQLPVQISVTAQTSLASGGGYDANIETEPARTAPSQRSDPSSAILQPSATPRNGSDAYNEAGPARREVTDEEYELYLDGLEPVQPGTIPPQSTIPAQGASEAQDTRGDEA